MTSKKKAHPDVAASRQARGTDFGGPVPTKDNNTTGSKCKSSAPISSLLLRGRENALSLKDLVRITGLDERVIRRQIHAERASGIMVIADNVNGYYLPADEHDVRMFARSMSHRAGEIAKIAQAAEIALAEMEGQERVEGW